MLDSKSFVVFFVFFAHLHLFVTTKNVNFNLKDGAQKCVVQPCHSVSSILKSQFSRGEIWRFVFAIE